MDKLLIKDARIISPENGMDLAGDILIVNGRIEALGWEISCPGAKELNAAGLVAAPGLVDLHVHLRDPGQTEKEDVLSGCRAAAAGGVTSLLCMPNTKPAIDSAETVRYILEKAKSADAHVYVAAAMTKGLESRELTDQAALKAAGARAFSDDGRPVTDTKLMARAMQKAHQLGLPVFSHCEDMDLTKGGLMNEGAVSAALNIPGVPGAGEDCGTARDIALAESYGVPVHICHVSTKTSVAMIRSAKARGVKVTAETGPHYFSLTDRELERRDADYRMSPPLRSEEDRLAVIAGLQDGTLDAIATDHAPHTPAEKADFNAAPNGCIGMETALAAGITYLVRPGHLGLSELIRHMSSIPARLLGVPGGILSQGCPADLVLFDPEASWVVDPEKLHGKSRNAVFKGRTLTGRVRYTLCGGRIVYGDHASL